LLERSRTGDLSAREELVRLTRGTYVHPDNARSYAGTARAAEEDDLVQPGSRSPYQPPRSKTPRKGKEGASKAAIIWRIIEPMLPPWG